MTNKKSFYFIVAQIRLPTCYQKAIAGVSLFSEKIAMKWTFKYKFSGSQRQRVSGSFFTTSHISLCLCIYWHNSTSIHCAISVKQSINALVAVVSATWPLMPCVTSLIVLDSLSFRPGLISALDNIQLPMFYSAGSVDFH